MEWKGSSMNEFIIYPAIDMKGGKVVRLLKGDMDKATEYGDDPLAQAKKFYDAGARWIHLVNLDGAVAKDISFTPITAGDKIPIHDGKDLNSKLDKHKNFDIIKKIAHWKNTEAKDMAKDMAKDIKLQIGGGIRRAEDARHWLENVDRIIVGTLAVEQTGLVRELIKLCPNQIAIAVDCHNGMVATRGWGTESTITALDFVLQFSDLPVAGFIHTDIARDGTGAGANWQESKKLVEVLRQKNGNIPVVVSGGINSLDEIKAIKQTGLFGGVIVGHAIYENKIDLKELFAVQSLK